MKKPNSLQFLKYVDGREIYIYTPGFGRWYYCNLEPMRLVRWVRLMLEFLCGGYKVFYLKNNGVFCSSCLTAEGGRRLKCATMRDIITGPSFTLPEYRGMGFRRLLHDAIVEYYYYSHDSICSYVKQTNIPSIKSMEKCGFVPVGKLKVVGLMRELIECPSGDHIIYRYDLKKRNRQENARFTAGLRQSQKLSNSRINFKMGLVKSPSLM